MALLVPRPPSSLHTTAYQIESSLLAAELVSLSATKDGAAKAGLAKAIRQPVQIVEDSLIQHSLQQNQPNPAFPVSHRDPIITAVGSSVRAARADPTVECTCDPVSPRQVIVVVSARQCSQNSGYLPLSARPPWADNGAEWRRRLSRCSSAQKPSAFCQCRCIRWFRSVTIRGVSVHILCSFSSSVLCMQTARGCQVQRQLVRTACHILAWKLSQALPPCAATVGKLSGSSQ
ncbi:hypothetical protein BaRGS_00019995 [Batillaria attramentaria]|uniref:Uncharacterized protein n=1 Tax=Batillaria attramentaria TaxID=370345 RepID=A0ABD0KP66_9CAEN